MTLFSFVQVLVQRWSSARTLVFVLAACLAFLAGSSVASALTFTWNGGSGGSDNWNDALNWTFVFVPLAPPTGPAFDGQELEYLFTGTKATSNIDVPWSVTDIVFDSDVTSMTFTGNALTFLENNEPVLPVVERIVNNSSNAHRAAFIEVLLIMCPKSLASREPPHYNGPVQLLS